MSSQALRDVAIRQEAKERVGKALALLSGGLDSTLAAKLLVNQGIEVEGVNFSTPFCLCDKCSVNKFARRLGIKIHRAFLGQEFLEIVAHPPHGYGSQMNPCLDCRILMFKKAKQLAKRVRADFLATGEVLDQRPFSQKKQAMLLIEKEAGLEGKVLRPLSAKLLPETEPEKMELVNRDQLLAISGKRRLPQMELAEKLGVKDYPNPCGGCLLTDPRFAERLRNHLEYDSRLTLRDVALLRLGRHFRINGEKVIVGRNEEENKRLLIFAEGDGIPYLETMSYQGPLTLIVGEEDPEVLETAAAITVRYSDAPKTVHVKVRYRGARTRIFEAEALEDEVLEKLLV